MDFTLNGKTVVVDATPGRSLLDVLRGDCGLRSMKDGCAPEGSCGACTVIVDGHAVVSCARPAERAAGRSVETLEGLPAAVRTLWADAFVATGASQCGYCSPGIVMKAEALLRRDPEASREAIARALAGNLCRCTGYASIIDAIALTAAVRRGAAAGVEPVTGPRYEGRELALGEKPFVGDLVAPGMLHGALRFAGVPRALVRSIDTTAARAVPGVVAVLTAADVPGRREQGLIRPDWPLLVAEGEIVRYVGDVLAAVAAETREAAAAAASLIEVELEALPAVTDPSPPSPTVRRTSTRAATSSPAPSCGAATWTRPSPVPRTWQAPASGPPPSSMRSWSPRPPSPFRRVRSGRTVRLSRATASMSTPPGRAPGRTAARSPRSWGWRRARSS